MLKIRLRKMGSKHTAFYRVVVSDSRLTPNGRFLDVLGTYDPRTEPPTVKIDTAGIERWVGKGAHPSPTVKSLLTRAKAGAA